MARGSDLFGHVLWRLAHGVVFAALAGILARAVLGWTDGDSIRTAAMVGFVAGVALGPFLLEVLKSVL